MFIILMRRYNHSTNYHAINTNIVEYYENGNTKIEKRQKKQRCIIGPTIVKYHENGLIKTIIWHNNGDKHRAGSPAFISYYKNGNVEKEMWGEVGNLHRINGPAIIIYFKNGNVYEKKYYICGKSPDIKEQDILQQRRTVGINQYMIRNLLKKYLV